MYLSDPDFEKAFKMTRKSFEKKFTMETSRNKEISKLILNFFVYK